MKGASLMLAISALCRVLFCWVLSFLLAASLLDRPANAQDNPFLPCWQGARQGEGSIFKPVIRVRDSDRNGERRVLVLGDSFVRGISGGAPSAAPAAPPNLDATGTTYSTTV
jgi:hypothetical protein